MKNQIPNVVTSLNLFCGCIAVVIALQMGYNYLPLCLLFVVLGAIFDFFDGFTARILKVKNIIGKDLDSLADCVTFGVVPSVVIFVFLQKNMDLVTHNEIVMQLVPYFAFLIAIFSALRLAKFNNDARQTDSFMGLNTPANTLFWVSFCAGISSRDLAGEIYMSQGIIYTVLIGIVVFSALLVSDLPMFSLKVKSFKLKGNIQRYFLFLFIIGTFYFLDYLSIAGAILLYIAMSIGNLKFKEIEKH